MRTLIVRENMNIILGRQGENDALCVVWSGIVTDWAALYGEGVFQLAVERAGEALPYPATVTVEDGDLVWVPTNADTALVGAGLAELTYTVGDAVAKSRTWRTQVYPSLTGEGETEPPEPYQSWVDKVLKAAAETEENAASAAISAENAETSAEAALASETAAKGSETAAKTSEENAAASETAAKNAQIAAEDAEVKAGISAVSSAENATQAAQSARDALAAQSGVETWAAAQTFVQNGMGSKIFPTAAQLVMNDTSGTQWDLDVLGNDEDAAVAQF